MAEITLLLEMVFIISLSTRIIHSECHDLRNYSFPVYKTDSCPGNQIEWNKRSSVLNCTKYNGYMCLPNKDKTKLLEFCYTKPKITIPKGNCLYLDKSSSKVNDFKCETFLDGCPNDDYQSVDIYKYPSCTSIGNGCFLAESSCNSGSQTSLHSKRLTTTTMVQNGEEKFKGTPAEEGPPMLMLILLPFAASVLLFSIFIFFCCRMKHFNNDSNYSGQESC